MVAGILKFALLFFSTLKQLSAIQNIDYCQLSCDNISNTVCDRKQLDCRLGAACGNRAKKITIDRNHITNLHNFYRNKVATGNEKRNRQPSAANMDFLTYNTDLEFVVQCWINACTFAHDHCRRIPKYKYVGQNLAILSTTAPSVNIKSVTAGMVKDWYDEVLGFDPATVNNFMGISAAGHYTQMLWADTKEIGCAMTYYKTGNWNNYLLGCNYGPGGNIIGRPVYKVGKPGSECYNRTRHNGFEGLCLN